MKYLVQVGKELLSSDQGCKSLLVLTQLGWSMGDFFPGTCPHHFTKILAGLYQVRKIADKPGPSLTQQKVVSLRLCPAIHILLVKSTAFQCLQRKKKKQKEFLNSAVG